MPYESIFSIKFLFGHRGTKQGANFGAQRHFSNASLFEEAADLAMFTWYLTKRSRSNSAAR